MRKTAIFFLILLLPFRIPLVNSAPDEGYGEANENLGQHTDTFENEDYVALLVDVIVNTTLECVELNMSGVSRLYENFTEYTEVDVGGDHITHTSDFHIEHESHRDEDTRLFYDYGADYFGDFYHEVDFESDFLEGGGLGYIWFLSDVADDAYGLYVADEDYIGLRLYRHPSSNDNRIYMIECDGGVYYTLDFNTLLARNTLYYLTINKTGVSWVVKIYTDSARTALFDTMSGTLQNDYSFDIVYACNSYNDGGDYDINNDVKNLWIGRTQGGYETDGYFLTEDYLNYTQGKSLALLTNASLPESTGITVQFSSDNSTWVDNHGAPGSSTIRANFSALDLRDLNYADLFMRYNLTGPGGSSSPRVYQSRLVTTEGTAGGVIESDAPWIALAIILSIIAFLLATRIKR